MEQQPASAPAMEWRPRLPAPPQIGIALALLALFTQQALPFFHAARPADAAAAIAPDAGPCLSTAPESEDPAHDSDSCPLCLAILLARSSVEPPSGYRSLDAAGAGRALPASEQPVHPAADTGSHRPRGPPAAS